MTEFIEKAKELSQRISKLRESVVTEEATKHSFVMPFIGLLGYDVFDPTVVVPEFTADISKKKNEKVDYAIMQDGEPIILIEVKTHSENLDNHATQLERYFTVTDTKFAILTNGVQYRFYSDLDHVNRMDKKPFLVINLDDPKERDLKKLHDFTKDQLDIDKIVNIASTQKYVMEIKKIFKEETVNPSDDLARMFASRITDKRLTQNILDDFKIHIKTAFSDIVYDMAQDKINSLKTKLTVEIDEKEESSQENDIDDKGIITTEDELEGFFIVKSILAETIELNRIAARDTKSYFGVLLDDNNRKWICRLHFNTKQKYIGLHIEDKQEEKIPLEKIEDIYQHKQTILDIINRLND